MRELPFKDTERAKYETVWSNRKYREQADGIPVVRRAFVQMSCQPGETLIDWGCGSGQCASAFQKMGLQVTGFDIAHNCLDKGIDIPLVVGTLWEPPMELESDFGFCTDVLEHLPPDYVEQSIEAISMRTLRACYFQVDTVPDSSGPKMSPPQRLHLCVRDPDWWLEKLMPHWPGGIVNEKGFYSRWRFVAFK